MVNVTDMHNQDCLTDPIKMNKEKLRGKFNLTINRTLPMKKQIEKFANEPVAYYLHKKRNFLEKLQRIDEQVDTDRQIARIKDQVDQVTARGNRDLYLQLNGRRPARDEEVMDPKWQDFNPLKFLREKRSRKRKLQSPSPSVPIINRSLLPRVVSMEPKLS